jgi:hypothetical protein
LLANERSAPMSDAIDIPNASVVLELEADLVEVGRALPRRSASEIVDENLRS